MTKVSVLIPFYNRASYLREAIDSILQQSFTDFEILALDDGSTDSSADIVSQYKDPRIRLLRSDKNLGIPATRNRGIAAARGEYLAFLDSDDLALPDRLAHQVEFLQGNPDHAAVGSWIEWIDQSGHKTGKVKRKPTSPEQIGAERLFRSGLENSTAMARTKILQAYPHREDMVLGSDYDLWARVAADYKLAALPEILVYRREHETRATQTKIDTTKALRLEIFAWQLRALNVAYSDEDLACHYILRRMQKENFIPDMDFLDWAEAWLLQLRDANIIACQYPEPAFSWVLGEFWLKTCWNARLPSGMRPWRRFWCSKLRSPALAGAARVIWDQIKASMKLINPF